MLCCCLSQFERVKVINNKLHIVSHRAPCTRRQRTTLWRVSRTGEFVSKSVVEFLPCLSFSRILCLLQIFSLSLSISLFSIHPELLKSVVIPSMTVNLGLRLSTAQSHLLVFLTPRRVQTRLFFRRRLAPHADVLAPVPPPHHHRKKKKLTLKRGQDDVGMEEDREVRGG